MKYPCGLIQDLLPLYHDGVCTEESKKIMEHHLSECPSCRDSYTTLFETDALFSTPQDSERERKKAASFCAVKKRMLKVQILVVISIFSIFAMLSLFVIGFMKNTQQIISYEDNISVSMVDNCLMGRLQGNQANYLKLKRVEIARDEQINTYLFFYLSGNKWDDIVTSDTVFSEYVLCPADKGATEIDSVFYYTGDYTGIETMKEDELQDIIDSSILLWNP